MRLSGSLVAATTLSLAVAARGAAPPLPTSLSTATNTKQTAPPTTTSATTALPTALSATPTPNTARKVNVDIPWFAGEPATDGARAGTSAATVTLVSMPVAGAPVRVSEAAGDGAAELPWGATGWTAALTAAHASSKPFLQNGWVVHAGGDVDGPSAGLLTAAAFVALLRSEPGNLFGVAVLPDVTLTGTVNPDGTAGPVAGIAQRIQAAAIAGKKRFGYPAGTRQSEDPTTGKLVDVEGYARSLGIEAIELRTLRDACRLLTGEDLGAPTLANDADVRITPEQMEAARVRVDMWRASAEAGYGRIQPVLAGLSDEARASLAWLYTPIFAAVNAAQGYERAGQLVAAEQKWTEVTIATAAAEDDLKILGAAGDGRLEDAFRVLAPYLELEAQADALLEDVAAAFAGAQDAVGAANAALAAETIVDGLALLHTGRAGLDAAVVAAKTLEADAAAGRADTRQETVQRFVILLLRTAPVLARAEAMLAAARMELAFEGNAETGGAVVDATRMPGLARAYAQAASAGATYFQRVTGLDGESATTFAFVEPAWATASAGAALATTYASRTSTFEHLFAVAGGAHAWLAASALQNKYGALGFKDGALQRRAALTAQLTAARETALASVAQLKTTTGKVPHRVRAAFVAAEELREGPEIDKLRALSSYWRATLAARLVGELGRR